MTSDLEDRLTRVLDRGARSITTTRAYRIVDSPGPTSDAQPRGPRRRRARTTWSVSVAAVAVMVTVLVSVYVLATHRNRSQPAHPAYCVLTGSAGFTSALQTGVLPTDSEVMAGVVDGTLLIAHERAGETSAIDLLTSHGRVTRIWTATAGQHVQAVANPVGAIGTDWVVFLLRSIGSPKTTVMVSSRGGKAIPLTSGDPGYVVSATARTAPVVVGDSLNILEASAARPSDQELLAYVTDPMPWLRTVGGRFTGVVQMLPVGGNLVLPRQANRGVDLTFVDPQRRPTDLAPAAHTGYSFTSDRTTLRWLTAEAGNNFLWEWAVGSPSPARLLLPTLAPPFR